jgi:uncharacterized protein YbjQ (UPF0145 family)
MHHGHHPGNHPPNLPPAPGWPIHPAMISTTNELPLFRVVRSYGIVRGLIVRSAGWGGGIVASFEALGSGNVGTLMIQHAAQMGANGIIGMRYDATEVGAGNQTLTEVLAYGTAVWADPI